MQQTLERDEPIALNRNGAGRIALLYSLVFVVTCLATGWNGPQSGAHAKTPGKTYCFNRKCHRVKTIAETRREIGKVRVVYASHYGDCRRDRYNPCGLTSSGERFRPNAADNAASPNYPDGTRLLVWNPRNGSTLVVRINNAGPYWGNRTLDLSRGAARKLGFARRGVARLHVNVLSAPTRAQARYRRLRRYRPVAGYIGKFGSMKMALLRAGRQIDGLPPVPVSKIAALQHPFLQLADVETRFGRGSAGQTTGVMFAALPSRRPMPPLPVAGLFRSEARTIRLAAARKKTLLRARTVRRKTVKRKRVRVAAAPPRRSKRARQRLEKRAKVARLPASIAAKQRANQKKVRVAALQKSSDTAALREPKVAPKPSSKKTKPIAGRATNATAPAKPTPRVSVVSKPGWREKLINGDSR